MFKFLRPGSVQAEIQLETASPNMSVVLQVVSSMDNLGNFSLDGNVTAIRREPGNVPTTIPDIQHSACGHVHWFWKKFPVSIFVPKKTDDRAHDHCCKMSRTSSESKQGCHRKKCQTYTNPQKKFPLCMKGLKKKHAYIRSPPHPAHPPYPLTLKRQMVDPLKPAFCYSILFTVFRHYQPFLQEEYYFLFRNSRCNSECISFTAERYWQICHKLHCDWWTGRPDYHVAQSGQRDWSEPSHKSRDTSSSFSIERQKRDGGRRGRLHLSSKVRN